MFNFSTCTTLQIRIGIRAMYKKIIITVISVCIIGVASSLLLAEGYSNTPLLPGGKWHVHDMNRPAPKVVTPAAAVSSTAPSDAIALFDGTDFSKWIQTKGIKLKDKSFKLITREPLWKIEDGHARIVGGTGTIATKDSFGSCQLHVEWASPSPKGKPGQKCGNSGIFLMGQYEIQVLDSFENSTYPDGQSASVYGQYPPLVNACRKPGEWQTYDIIFEAPKFKERKLVTPAYVTVIHNGVLVQNHTEILGPTKHKRLTKYTPHADKLPLSLQEHGDPVRYRNIWIRPL